MTLRITRKDDETWRECAARYADRYGLNGEVLDYYDSAVARGIDEGLAAWEACVEWDIAEFVDEAHEGSKCPLGCAIGPNDGPFPSSCYASEKLGVPIEWTRSFTAGYDETGSIALTDHVPSFLLGMEYRRRALGEVKWGER